MIAPWPFIRGTDDMTEPGVRPNAPCELGAELGTHVARFFDAEYVRTGRDSRCETCAFRLGTIANQCGATLLDAMKASIEETPFNCHETDRPCGGWVAMVTAKHAPHPDDESPRAPELSFGDAVKAEAEETRTQMDGWNSYVNR